MSIKTSLASLCVSTFGLLALTASCAVEAPTDEEVAEADAPLCSSPSPVDSAMAAIAVAAAREMGRLIGTADFRWNSATGKLEIHDHGRRRCNYVKPGSTCPNTQAAIDLQNAPSNTVKFPTGYLDAGALRNALKANYAEQVACEQSGSCRPKHWDLKYHSLRRSECFVEYFFDAYKQYEPAKITRQSELEQYGASNMRFLGYPENKMLNFYVTGEHISIDPTSGLNEGGTATSGSCTVACTKYSTSYIAGTCCSCEGVSRRYQQSSFSRNMYLCR